MPPKPKTQTKKKYQPMNAILKDDWADTKADEKMDFSEPVKEKIAPAPTPAPSAWASKPIAQEPSTKNEQAPRASPWNTVPKEEKPKEETHKVEVTKEETPKEQEQEPLEEKPKKVVEEKEEQGEPNSYEGEYQPKKVFVKYNQDKDITSELPTEPPFMLKIFNLSYQATKQDVKNFFDGCKLLQVFLAIDKETQRPRGSGTVEFADYKSMKYAVDTYKDADFMGRSLRMEVQERERALANCVAAKQPRREHFGGHYEDRGARPMSKPIVKSEADTEGSWQRGSAKPTPKPAPTPKEEIQANEESHHTSFNSRRGNRGGYGGFSRGRGDRSYGGNRGFNRDGEESQSQAHPQRKRLNLAPRTVEAPINALSDAYNQEVFGKVWDSKNMKSDAKKKQEEAEQEYQKNLVHKEKKLVEKEGGDKRKPFNNKAERSKQKDFHVETSNAFAALGDEENQE